MISDITTIKELRQQIKEAQYLYNVAVETAKKIRAYDKNLYPYMIKQAFENDKRICCNCHLFSDLVLDTIENIHKLNIV